MSSGEVPGMGAVRSSRRNSFSSCGEPLASARGRARPGRHDTAAQALPAYLVHLIRAALHHLVGIDAAEDGSQALLLLTLPHT